MKREKGDKKVYLRYGLFRGDELLSVHNLRKEAWDRQFAQGSASDKWSVRKVRVEVCDD